MADGNKPLVTFFVIAYNQSRFIREAVESALAQTYSPMEIVLSDDCSTDSTFEIIVDLVRTYSGPHTVIVNRNERNLGLSDHLNKILELANGELIIAADGDDISVPRRTERSVEVWLENGKPAALATSVSCIDADGNRSNRRTGPDWFMQALPDGNERRTDNLLRFAKCGSPKLVSCSAAWTKTLCDAFGPLPQGIWFEDVIITLRAWLFDRIVFVPEALVQYREHDSNLHNRAPVVPTSQQARRRAEQRTLIDARRWRETLLAYGPDLDLAVQHGWISNSVCEEIKRDVAALLKFHQVFERWWTVSWPKRVSLFLFVARSGDLNEARWCIPRLLPFPVFLALSATWSRRPWLLRFGARRALPVSPSRPGLTGVLEAVDERSTFEALGPAEATGKQAGIDSGTLRVVLRDS